MTPNGIGPVGCGSIYVKRIISHLDFGVEFTVSAGKNGFEIKANVTTQDQYYPQVKIHNFPKIDCTKEQEVMHCLKAHAIDCINQEIYFLSKSPLDTFRSWKQQMSSGKITQEVTEINAKIIALEGIVSTISNKKDSYLGREYIYLGDHYFTLQHYLEADRCYQKSLLKARSQGDQWVIGAAQGSLGNVYEKMGDLRSALNLHKKHLRIAEGLQDEGMIARIKGNMGIIYTHLGEVDLARTFITEYLNYFKKSQSKNSIDEAINAYNNLGFLYDSQGKFVDAIKMYQEVLSLTQKPLKRGDVYINLGTAYNSLACYEKAIEFYELAEAEYKKSGVNSPACPGGLGNAHYNLGNYLKALRFCRITLRLYKQNGEKGGEATSYGNLGNAYDALSKVGTVNDLLPEDAISFSTQAELRNHYKKEALAAYTKSEELAKESGLASAISTASINLSEFFYLENKYAEALKYSLEALAVCERTQDTPGLASIYRFMGHIYKNSAEFNEAEDCYSHSLELFQKVGMRLSAGHNHTLLGILYKEEKNYDRAIDSLQQAIEIFSDLQKENTANNVQHSISFFETIFYPYRLLEKTYLKNLNASTEVEEHAKIITLSDSGRARTLVSILNQKLGIDQPLPITMKQVNELASELKTTIVIYSCAPFSATEGWCWVISPQGEIRYKELDLSMVSEEQNFKSNRPSYLRSDCANNGVERSSYLFFDDVAIDEVAFRGNPSDQRMEKLPVHQLWYQALIEPIACWLPTEAGARVTIVADSAIHQLPFAIFSDATGMPLIDKYTLIAIPSIETLLKIKERDEKQKGTRQFAKVCIVANPTGDLKGAQQEGVNAKDFFTESISLPNTATNQEVIESFSSVGSIHLACHGAMTDSKERPVKKAQDSVFQGALTLAEGPLFADDIVPISMNVDLAILSACESGKGHLRREGVVGLYHAFLGSGASTVIATHWKVPDQQANAIISSFYKAYFNKEGERDSFDGQCFGKAEALRQAQLEMKKKYPANRQAWGGFFLIGLPG